MATIAAIYARVSTTEQSTLNQISELKALAAQRGLTIFKIYEDTGYTGKNDRRPEFQAMLRDAVSGRFNVLLAWHIDRIGRQRVGIQRAKLLGVYKGRRGAIADSKKAAMAAHVLVGGGTYRSAAELHGVSVGSVQRAVAEHR